MTTHFTNNFIGTDRSGNSALPNEENGILLRSDGNQIGLEETQIPTERPSNVISGNDGSGIYLSNSNNNNIVNNAVGTSSDFLTALGNGVDGLTIEGNNNRIGWKNTGAFMDRVVANVFSANFENGIHIFSGENNNIAGNWIGTNRMTNSMQINVGNIGNGSNGILVNEAAGRTVIGRFLGGEGLPCASYNSYEICSGNVVSANGNDGIAFVGQNKGDGNTSRSAIEKNLIGVDWFGETALGNLANGISFSESVNPTVQDNEYLVDVRSNVISANHQNGMMFDGLTDRIWVTNNKIGLDLVGDTSLGNEKNGIHIRNGAKNLTLGLESSFQIEGIGNAISGNLENGIRIDGVGVDGHIISGNRIGLNYLIQDDTQTQPDSLNPNEFDGIHISGAASHIKIGKDDGFDFGISQALRKYGNTISGNLENGVFLDQFVSNVHVTGNRIGLGWQEAPAPNELDGVRVLGFENYIGLDGDEGVPDSQEFDQNEGNIIAGNRGNGVSLGPGATGNKIAANSFFRSAFGNELNGVLLDDADYNFVGTDNDGFSDSDEGNQIRWSLGSGVKFVNSDYNLIAGNNIDSNFGHGIEFLVSSNNQIGKTSYAEFDLENTVSSPNGLSGLYVESGFNNAILGNDFVGNGSHGIHLVDSNDNSIGERLDFQDQGLGNLISGNMGDGIHIEEQNGIARGNHISQNSIHTNGELGINLAGGFGEDSFGVTPNSARNGPNHFVDFATLTFVDYESGVATIEFEFTAFQTGVYLIDFYSGAEGDVSGHGEGDVFEKRVHFVVPRRAFFYSGTVELMVPENHFVSSTVTHSIFRSTSEFSAWVEVSGTGNGGGGETFVSPPNVFNQFSPLQDWKSHRQFSDFSLETKAGLESLRGSIDLIKSGSEENVTKVNSDRVDTANASLFELNLLDQEFENFFSPLKLLMLQLY